MRARSRAPQRLAAASQLGSLHPSAGKRGPGARYRASAKHSLYQRQDEPQLDDFVQSVSDRLASGSAAGPRSVYLVGTGPGDPGLMTLQAAHLLQTADVILYDRLVSEEILRMSKPEATLVYVGKQQGLHSRSQAEIHELLLRFACTGARTIRLKGGDPFVFGRGAVRPALTADEEAGYLEARGVVVHIVAGITAAAGISALLGVPLTHRGVATSVRFLTGHAQDGDAERLDEAVCAAADPYTTLVVYMGLATLPALAARLCARGMPGDKAAVAVERGTLPDSRLCHASLEDLPERAAAAGLRSPTLIMIGDVVALSPGWQMWREGGQPLTQPAPLPLQIDLSGYQQNYNIVSRTSQDVVAVGQAHAR